MQNTPENKVSADDEKLLSQLEHRVTLIDTTDKELENTYHQQQEALTEQQALLTMQMSSLRKEIKQAQATTKELRKTIFHLGHQLKNKATKQTLTTTQEKIDSWPLESYITKKELQERFKKL